jgi:hypothetical protein
VKTSERTPTVTLHFSEDSKRSLCGISQPGNWMTIDGADGNAVVGSRLCGNCQSITWQRERRKAKR